MEHQASLENSQASTLTGETVALWFGYGLANLLFRSVLHGVLTSPTIQTFAPVCQSGHDCMRRSPDPSNMDISEHNF